MTTAQVVETSVTVNNSSIQDYFHSDDHAEPTYLWYCFQRQEKKWANTELAGAPSINMHGAQIQR